MAEFFKSNFSSETELIIKVVGVGGGGSNAVNHMFRQGIKAVNFVVCNTDSQALANSPVPEKIQLGQTLTEGRGAGNKPDQGRQAALESLDDIIQVLADNTKMVFITAGMGGGTGTGAAPVLAKAAKELGILTVGIVTIPFRFEGQRRINQAIEGITELSQYVDSLLVINNEKLREIFGDLRVSEAFAKADNILTIAAKGIAEIIGIHGQVNVDFADVQTVMTNSGVALMGSGEAEGEDRAMRAIQNALHSPLLNCSDIKGAKNVLLNITSGRDEVTMDETYIISEFVQEATGYTADIIWGKCDDENLGEKISVTVIATGFETDVIPEIHNYRRLNKKNPNVVEKIPAKNISVPQKNEKESVENQKKTNSLDDDLDFIVKSKIQENTNTVVLNENSDTYIVQEKKTNETSSLDDVDLKIQERLNEIKQKFLKSKDQKNTSYQKNLEELETEPAYIRKKIEVDTKNLNENPNQNVKKYSLSDDSDASK